MKRKKNIERANEWLNQYEMETKRREREVDEEIDEARKQNDPVSFFIQKGSHQAVSIQIPPSGASAGLRNIPWSRIRKTRWSRKTLIRGRVDVKHTLAGRRYTDLFLHVQLIPALTPRPSTTPEPRRDFKRYRRVKSEEPPFVDAHFLHSMISTPLAYW